MITKKIHAELVKKWSKVGRGIYQKWTRIQARMPFFLKYVEHFKGKQVLELGCNAGVYGYEISKVAESYIGVDQGDYYIDQANVTKKHFQMDNAKFFHGNVKDFIKADQRGEMPSYNALFASFALYHFSDKETDRIKSHVLPKCNTVIIQTRTQKRTPWKKYNSLKLHKVKNVEKYLHSAGFTCKTYMHPSKKFGETIGVKNVDN